MNLTNEMVRENEVETKKIILKNEYFCFSSQKKNNYIANCKIENNNNNNIRMNDLLNFNLLKLMYQLNSDIFETIDFTIINENEANVYLLIKPLLKNLGIWQRFVSLKFTRSVLSDDTVIFVGVPDHEYGKLKHTCKNAIFAPLNKIIFYCDVSRTNMNALNLTTYFCLEENFVFPMMLEKLVGTIFKRVYKNIKKGIESL